MVCLFNLLHSNDGAADITDARTWMVTGRLKLRTGPTADEVRCVCVHVRVRRQQFRPGRLRPRWSHAGYLGLGSLLLTFVNALYDGAWWKLSINVFDFPAAFGSLVSFGLAYVMLCVCGWKSVHNALESRGLTLADRRLFFLRSLGATYAPVHFFLSAPLASTASHTNAHAHLNINTKNNTYTHTHTHAQVRFPQRNTKFSSHTAGNGNRVSSDSVTE